MPKPDRTTDTPEATQPEADTPTTQAPAPTVPPPSPTAPPKPVDNDALGAYVREVYGQKFKVVSVDSMWVRISDGVQGFKFSRGQF